MPLLNPNGTPYTTAGSLQHYDPESPQHDLFNLWDEEAIQQAGSPVYYKELYIPTGEIDTDYMEARGALFSPHPIQLWASYDPMASQNYMSAFGIDSMNEVILELNYRAVLRTIGHPPKLGSIIYTPHLGENWEIIQRNLGEFKMWGALRLQLICRQFQESVTRQSGRATANPPKVKKALE